MKKYLIKNWYYYTVLLFLLLGYLIPTVFFSKDNGFGVLIYNGFDEIIANKINKLLLYAFEGIIIITLIVISSIMFIKKSEINNELSDTKKLSQIGIYSGLALILSLISFPLVLPFLLVEISVVVILLTTIIIDYRSGIIVALTTSILIYIVRGSMVGYPIDQIAYFIGAFAFVTPVCFYISKDLTMKNTIIGLIIGILITTFTMILLNYLWITPVYIELFTKGGFYEYIGIEEPNNFFMWISITYGIFNLIKYSIISFLSAIIIKTLFLGNKKVL